ncbi:uroporphyrinogen decarboxylase family protein [Bacteroides sp.]
MRKWINQVLERKAVMALPIMTHPGIELIGETVRRAVTDGEVHYKAIQAVTDYYHTDSCTVIMDLTVEAEAFGAKIKFPEDEVPTVIDRLITDGESVRKLQIPDLNQGRIPEYLKANKLAVEHIKDKPVFSGCIGPYSLAGRLYDMSEIMVAIYIEPDMILELLAKCTEFLINYCAALKEIGTAGVIIAEPAAGLLSNEDCQTYSTEFVKQIVDAVQDDNFTVILHNCGNTGQCTRAMVDSGARALHFGNKIDMLDAIKECPSNVLVMGNIDPVSVIKQGDSKLVAQETMKLLECMHEYSNFAISTGCDVPPQVPEENIRAFFDTVNAFNS